MLNHIAFISLSSYMNRKTICMCIGLVEFFHFIKTIKCHSNNRLQTLIAIRYKPRHLQRQKSWFIVSKSAACNITKQKDKVHNIRTYIAHRCRIDLRLFGCMKSIWRINTICGFRTTGRGLTRRDLSCSLIFRWGFTRRDSICRYFDS
jgi:hypothetical protein